MSSKRESVRLTTLVSMILAVFGLVVLGVTGCTPPPEGGAPPEGTATEQPAEEGSAMAQPAEEGVVEEGSAEEGSAAEEAVAEGSAAEEGAQCPMTAAMKDPMGCLQKCDWTKCGTKIFNGEDLTGWRHAHDAEAENQWSVEDGAMTNVEHGNDIATEEEWRDFALHIEYKTVEGGNSGIYLRGRTEVQVLDSYGNEEVNDHDAGAVFGLTPPLVNASNPAGEWNTVDACYIGGTLSVMLNGQVVQNNTEVVELTGGALPGDVNDPGPLRLQGDHGKVWYRNIIICSIDELVGACGMAEGSACEVTDAAEETVEAVGNAAEAVAESVEGAIEGS